MMSQSQLMSLDVQELSMNDKLLCLPSKPLFEIWVRPNQPLFGCEIGVVAAPGEEDQMLAEVTGGVEMGGSRLDERDCF